MADLFDVSVGGVGFHLTSHLIALAALFIACFAIAGYINFREDSIPPKALEDDGSSDDDVTFDEVKTRTLDVTSDATISQLKQPLNLVPAAANDTTITKLVSGQHYHWGTATGLPGAADATGAFTFQLPTPTQAGERIELICHTGTAYAKLVGISVQDPATTTITYNVIEAGASVEVATTATGVDGTANTMVKIANSHQSQGDKYICTSLSTTAWYVEIIGAGGAIGAGDIAVDPGNVLGYID